MKTVTARAYSNIALNKYWGKRDIKLNLPTKSSISLSINALYTDTTISRYNHNQDTILFNGSLVTEKDREHICAFLKIFRQEFAIKDSLLIDTRNSFCHAAGLASSASGFAALTLALNALFKLELSTDQLSCLARRGSGSACRSIKGGFVHWDKGTRCDGKDSIGRQIVPSDHWQELRILIVIIDQREKKISSRNGMHISINTSHYYSSWINQAEKTIPMFFKAVYAKDFKSLSHLTQDEWHNWQNILNTSNPPLHYIQPSTVKVLCILEQLQLSGVDCFYTTDAGPNVHVVCMAQCVERIKSALELSGQTQAIITSTIASDPYLIGQ